MSDYRRTPLALALAIAGALLAPGIAAAQDGEISGTVTDATGLVLPGVTVEARDAAGSGQVAVSDGAGQFTLGGLAPGTYEVTFTLPGFNAPPQIVDVGAGAAAPLDVRMEIGLEELVVVVGSRAQPRSVTESTVPVDVISTREFAALGDTDLTNQLRAIVPSFNVATQPISDAATIVRPVNLRNLAPDHTLILVNGKRRHRAAVITWLGNGVADGSQGPDISVIPSIALRQVEVLRDGASAQYGSDAIAGVMNFQLKDARSGGAMEFRTGVYRDTNNGVASSDAGNDFFERAAGGRGQAYSFAGNVGLPLGRNGFANLSLEYGGAQPTNRSVQRNDAQRIIDAGNPEVRDPAQVWGSPAIDDDLKLFGNFGSLFDNGLQWYGHTNYASKTVTGGFYFRNPHTRGAVFSGDGGQSLLVGDRLWASTLDDPGGPTLADCPTIPVVGNVPDADALAAVEADPNCFTLYSRFPGGFTPNFGGTLTDYSLVTGLKGLTSGGLTWDASVNIGSNEVDQFIENTVNASLGYDTPTSFNPGAYRQEDVNLNFDLSYAVNDMIHLAGGTEWRDEQFTIRAGGRPSWEIGPYAAQGFSSGSNGFNGYREDVAAGTWNRRNVAVYGDLEVQDPGGRWTLGSAARIESFDTFGTTMNSKLSARVAANDVLALRAAVSSGFRAPTPGQQNAVNVSTIFDYDIQDLINRGVVPSTSPAAMLKGGEVLQPETSINYSVGSVVDTGPFTFTADYFQIDVEDRIALTQQFRLTSDEVDSLIRGGFAEARNLATFVFFANDFSTRTRGVDLVSTWAPPALGGSGTISLVYNYTDTEVTTPESPTIDERRIQAIEFGLPKNRWNVAYNHLARRVNFLARLSYYGSYWDDEDAANNLGSAMAVLYPFYSGKPLLDLEVGFPFGDTVTLSVGAQNALNTYPDVNDLAADRVGNIYGQFSPFGFNGAYYYTRISYGWGG